MPLTRQIIDAALVDLNKARVALDLPELDKVPMGYVGEPANCPMWHGLRNGFYCEVNGPRIIVSDREHAIKLSEAWFKYNYVSDYPEYVFEASDGVPTYVERNEYGEGVGYAVDAPESIYAFVTLFDSTGKRGKKVNPYKLIAEDSLLA